MAALLMSLLPLYFDVTSKRLVRSETDPDEFVLPTLCQQDGLPLSVFALRRISQFASPLFERVDLTGYGMVVSIGSAGTVLASQNLWTVGNGGCLEGSVDLSTAALEAAFGTATEITKTLEIKLVVPSSGLPWTGLWSVRITKRVFSAGTLVPIPGDTALGSLEASRMYMKKVMAAGEGFEMVSQSGLRAWVYLDDSGVLKADPIT